MHYGQMVEDSLRGVVRTALIRAATDGLLGEHHFYIGFNTQAPGVDIPDHLRAQYPEEMTIVIQHKFWGLEVSDEAFEITLSFNGQGQRLHIPFSALTSFLDPSVQFGLQFGLPKDSAEDGDAAAGPESGQEAASEAGDDGAGDDTAAAPEDDSGPAKTGDNVVTLDKFRKD